MSGAPASKKAKIATPVIFIIHLTCSLDLSVFVCLANHFFPHPHPLLSSQAPAIDAGVQKLALKLVEIRRHLHAHAELSFQEEATAEYILARLQEIEGVEDIRTGLGRAPPEFKGAAPGDVPYTRPAKGTGLTAYIRGTLGDGPCILIRADIDVRRATSRCSSLLPSAYADARSSNDAIAFKGAPHPRVCARLWVRICKHRGDARVRPRWPRRDAAGRGASARRPPQHI